MKTESSRLMIVAIAAFACCMAAMANPIAVDDSPRLVTPLQVDAIGESKVIEDAMREVVKNLNLAEETLKKNLGNGGGGLFQNKKSLKNAIVVFRAGKRYVYDISKFRRERKFELSNFDYCGDDSYWVGGHVVTGVHLARTLSLTLALQGLSGKENGTICVFCLKKGTEKAPSLRLNGDWLW